MREYINLIQQLSEAAVGMSAGEIKKYPWRFEKFIEYIKTGKPFTTVDGEEVVIDPREAKRFHNMYHIGNTFGGSLTAKIKGSDEQIPLSKLAKTGDFGGAAVAVGQDPSKAGKEALVIKPSQIGICDKDIPGANLYGVIHKNKALRSTDYGKVVTNLATFIINDQPVVLPADYKSKDKEKVRKAIVDYAGEYLGVLALLSGRSRFPRKKQFEEWLGGSIADLIIRFPKKANVNIADSYASIKNPRTKHTINISSKGTGGGAAPAISGLKIPDFIRNDPTFDVAVEFIDICRKKGTIVAGTIEQAFAAMDLIFKNNPKSLNKMWHKYLPFATKNPKLMELCAESIDAGKSNTEYSMPKKYAEIIDSVSGKGTEGGKIVYAIKKEVADAINNRDAIPEFANTILQILEMNFIQQYADYSKGELTFATQWPAKLDGNISVENKSSGADPTSGGFSFKLGRVDDSVSSEPDQAAVDNLGSQSEEDFISSADVVATGRRLKSPAKTPGDVGRKKR